MDLDRIRAACNRTESNVRVIADRRLARRRTLAWSTIADASTRAKNGRGAPLIFGMLTAGTMAIIAAYALTHATYVQLRMPTFVGGTKIVNHKKLNQTPRIKLMNSRRCCQR